MFLSPPKNFLSLCNRKYTKKKESDEGIYSAVSAFYASPPPREGGSIPARGASHPTPGMAATPSPTNAPVAPLTGPTNAATTNASAK